MSGTRGSSQPPLDEAAILKEKIQAIDEAAEKMAAKAAEIFVNSGFSNIEEKYGIQKEFKEWLALDNKYDLSDDSKYLEASGELRVSKDKLLAKLPKGRDVAIKVNSTKTEEADGNSDDDEVVFINLNDDEKAHDAGSHSLNLSKKSNEDFKKFLVEYINLFHELALTKLRYKRLLLGLGKANIPAGLLESIQSLKNAAVAIPAVKVQIDEANTSLNAFYRSANTEDKIADRFTKLDEKMSQLQKYYDARFTDEILDPAENISESELEKYIHKINKELAKLKKFEDVFAKVFNPQSKFNRNQLIADRNLLTDFDNKYLELENLLVLLNGEIDKKINIQKKLDILLVAAKSQKELAASADRNLKLSSPVTKVSDTVAASSKENASKSSVTVPSEKNNSWFGTFSSTAGAVRSATGALLSTAISASSTVMSASSTVFSAGSIVLSKTLSYFTGETTNSPESSSESSWVYLHTPLNEAIEALFLDKSILLSAEEAERSIKNLAEELQNIQIPDKNELLPTKLKFPARDLIHKIVGYKANNNEVPGSIEELEKKIKSRRVELERLKKVAETKRQELQSAKPITTSVSSPIQNAEATSPEPRATLPPPLLPAVTTFAQPAIAQPEFAQPKPVENKSFFGSLIERHPILTGIGIAVAIGLSVAAAIGLSFLIPGVGTAIGGLVIVKTVTTILGVVGASAAGVGACATIGAIGGVAGGIVTANTGKGIYELRGKDFEPQQDSSIGHQDDLDKAVDKDRALDKDNDIEEDSPVRKRASTSSNPSQFGLFGIDPKSTHIDADMKNVIQIDGLIELIRQKEGPQKEIDVLEAFRKDLVIAFRDGDGAKKIVVKENKHAKKYLELLAKYAEFASESQKYKTSPR